MVLAIHWSRSHSQALVLVLGKAALETQVFFFYKMKSIYFHPSEKYHHPLDDDRLLYRSLPQQPLSKIIPRNHFHSIFVSQIRCIIRTNKGPEWKSVPNRLWQWWHDIRWIVRPWMIERDKFLSRNGEGTGRLYVWGAKLPTKDVSPFTSIQNEILWIDAWGTPSAVIFKYRSQSSTDSWVYQKYQCKEKRKNISITHTLTLKIIRG